MWQNTAFMIHMACKKKEKKVLVQIALYVVLTVAVSLANLFILPTILSAIEVQISVLKLIAIIMLFVVGLAFANALLRYIEANFLFGRVSLRMVLIGEVNNKALITSYPNLSEEKFMKMAKQCSENCLSDNRSSGELIWTTLTTLCINFISFVLYSLLFVNVQPVLIAVIVATSVISYLVSNKLSGYRYVHREEEGKTLNQMVYINAQTKSWKAAKDIRIFGLKNWFNELYYKSKDAYLAFQNKAESIYLWGRVLDVVLSFLRNGLAYYYLVSLVIADKIAITQFILLFSAVSGFTEWIVGLLSGLNTLHKQSLDISTLREFLEYKEPFKFEDGKPLVKEDIPYELSLNNVSFCYPNAQKDTLKNINLTLHSGEKLAIVGLNGAGKTTLVKLMCGFLDPTSGCVTLNGQDIRQYNRKDYYALFSAVFQQFSLLPTSINANVAQSENDIDFEKVKRCIASAGLEEKVQSLPEGYQTKLNRDVFEDAVMLSGGQNQRLMLARALYKDAPFVILDEPTAALDPIAEAEIYNKYNEMTKNKSSVFISHRLASTRFCDKIILIDDGSVAEEGTHSQLLDAKGKYFELFSVQSKYYKENANETEQNDLA